MQCGWKRTRGALAVGTGNDKDESNENREARTNHFFDNSPLKKKDADTTKEEVLVIK